MANPRPRKKLAKIQAFVFVSLLSCFQAVSAKECYLGNMSCEDYCSGPLVVKLYLLMEQGSRTLCDINLHYTKQKGGLCWVSIDKVNEPLDRAKLVIIARTIDHDRFNTLLSSAFKQAANQCPRIQTDSYWF